ncbi:MAG: hypothetical protein ACRC4M_05930 [Mycoplasma sp.]
MKIKKIDNETIKFEEDFKTKEAMEAIYALAEWFFTKTNISEFWNTKELIIPNEKNFEELFEILKNPTNAIKRIDEKIKKTRKNQSEIDEYDLWGEFDHYEMDIEVFEKFKKTIQEVINNTKPKAKSNTSTM